MNFMEHGRPIGIVIDLAKALAERMHQPVEIRLMDWTQAQQLVLEGRADALLQINPSQERLKIYDFSEPLLTSEFTIFTSAKRLGIASMSDLRGLKVGVEKKGLPILLLQKDPQIILEIIPDFVQGFRMLATGAVDAVVADRWVGSYVLAENNIQGMKLIGDPVSRSHSAIAVKKGNTKLLADINAGLADIRRDGTYERIIKSWQSNEVVFKTREQLRQQMWLLMAIAAALIAALLGIAALVRAIQQRKRVEATLRESEERFRGLFEQAAVGVAEIEMSTGRFFTVNRRLCEMVGRTEEELLATTFQAITHPEDLHLHEEKTALLFAGKIGHYSLEKRYLRKDGEIVWVNLGVSPLWKMGGEPGRNMTVVEDITDRKRMEEEILALSITDQLTGLHNRRGFLSLAGQQLKIAERNKNGMLLLFADLDGLKWINDKLGHEEGDKALIEAATIFKETFRTSDIIARLGGDEYAALAVDITDANSELFTTRLQFLIDTRNNQENRRYSLSISVGCSYYDPENPCSLDELMASADKLMYEQKQNKKRTLPQDASLSNGIH
jgi:diguanylate cyclase (GGDEF)-like protein/PAS domain S-box-containing protein